MTGRSLPADLPAAVEDLNPDQVHIAALNLADPRELEASLDLVAGRASQISLHLTRFARSAWEQLPLPPEESIVLIAKYLAANPAVANDVAEMALADGDRWFVGDLDAYPMARFARALGRVPEVQSLRQSWKSITARHLYSDGFEETKLLEAGFSREDLDLTFTAYLSAWWWRSTVVGSAISAIAGSDAGVEAVGLEVLSPGATALSAAAIEPFIGSTQQYIGGAKELSPEDETFLLAELDIIRAQHRVIEGADALYVRRAVGRIVGRLYALEQVGDQARTVLTDLGAEPPEVVDEIVEGMREFADLVATRWADANLDPQTDSLAAALPFSEAADKADGVAASIEMSSGPNEALRQRFANSIVDGAGKTVGAAAASAGIGAAGALAVAVWAVPGIDAAILWLIEAAPRLYTIYTYGRQRIAR